ncbi:MAG: P-loop NTPase [Spirochaetales bacterium]|nr:P-loop NTPase [Spirochaetales bacterium]
MTIFLPVASGKGGTGKSLFSTNLGASLAAAGKTTILVDLDLGGSNLHTCLGIKNNHPGLGYIIQRKEKHIQALLVETGIPRLHFIPGDSLFPGSANLEFFVKQKIIKDLRELKADYIILDLGAGTNFNVIDFFLMTHQGLVLTAPETTAILNSYSFLKTALFRLLFRSFPPRSAERKAIASFISQRIEGSGSNFHDLVKIISTLKDASGKLAQRQLAGFFPRVILNQCRSQNDINIGARLRDISRRNLGVEIEYIGVLPHDPNLPASLIKRKPLYALAPESPFCRSVDEVRNKIIALNQPGHPPLYEADEDLGALLQQLAPAT